MHNYDVVIIGSGLGGLVCGAILSRNGYRVGIYEKNRQAGGCLQTFSREKVIFDSGVHYIGGLGAGENLHKVFKYLGILDQLKLKRMDMDGFDHISFGADDTVYRMAQGEDNFIRTLLTQFPDEKKALQDYCDMIREVCSKFPLYNLREGDYEEKRSVLQINAVDFLRNVTRNERLQQVLAGNNLLYAGVAEKTPFYVHALVLNSYIQSSWKCVDGGSQISKWLCRRITENGGAIIRNTAVTAIRTNGDRVDHIVLQDGTEVRAQHFISNLHPAQTLEMTESTVIRNAYRSRIAQLENSVGAFVLNVVLKPGTFRYLNYNYYYHASEDAWAGIDYQVEAWPQTYAMYVSASSRHETYADSLSIMTYMRYEEMAPWQDTFNTVLQPDSRGAGYEAFKKDRTERLIACVEKKFPGFRHCIQSTYVATPLSYRDYIGSGDGSMYGIQKDSNDPLRTMVSARTKLSNLYLTGQNLNLHGILGVTISGVITSAELLGTGFLVDAINQSTHQ
ncbi:phytoene desaturase family protein [Chitinophaga nivalis]|uniref:NAD(P)/FAD-dependent oxidoreductase n=1 Tax=Chitinophaga nivalis TaxID=2991709 RepID=A0ABT3IG94_9BACT|nr:NAD(P)/FAD-dependent oxidoreductase [Chitinophaga nivalis]MCW3467524.1 NAD(P)/FAD-dependent oxidoreductase [Chitinophaga nivalis]MCW3482784.1 NAD(P)/FAD-dependent oxidoreductase [Chitinophaga nivalis]